MPKYIVSGKNVHGQNITEVVHAPSADEAVRRYQGRGFADVVLHTDEVMSHVIDPRVFANLTPQEFLALGRVSRLEFVFRLIVRLYRQQWFLFLLMIALIVGRRVMDVPWGFVDYLALAFLSTPPLIVVLGEVFSPSRKFERAMALAAWARWADMLAALPGARASVPEMAYAFFEAKALTGLGRLDEALERVRPFAEDPKTPPWLYWGQLADVFTVARLGDRAIECLEKAHEDAPDNATVLIDLALARLRFRRDTVSARPLLEQARNHEVSEPLLPFLLMTEGILALEEKQPDPARRLLEESLTRAEPLRHMSALVGAAIDRIHTYLCLACAAAGDPTAAEQHFRQAEPRIRAFAATDLLERCQSALGIRP